MKNCADKLLKTLICILLIISLTGCWNRRELDTLGVVMGVGIDKSEEPDKVKVTAQVVKPGDIKSHNKEGSNSSQTFWNISNDGDTVFSTLRDMTNKSSRKLFFPHNQVIIFSKSIAEDGMQKYLNFFTRDHETRMNVLILISEDNASEILNVKPEFEKVPADNISKLVEGQAAATSQAPAVKLRDFLTKLVSKTTSPTAPFIKLTRDGDKKAVMISGTAVFKGDKLVGSMNKHEGRGLLWILGDVKSGIIEVEGSGNDKVCLEIISASSKIVPEIKNNKITIKVNIFEEGNIDEQTGLENLSKLSEVASLEKKKADVIKSEVISAVEKAQELDSDVFGFGDDIHQKYPKQWKNLESNWDETFKTIQVQVNVKTKLRLIGRLIKPNVQERKEE
ncbi:MAG: Ger(x)C family spore germination protein [Bacillota bacterium]|nr:Ger(x)C family spore germination protein [Bacillota bacterium]